MAHKIYERFAQQGLVRSQKWLTLILRLFGSKSLNWSAGAAAPLLYTCGVKRSVISVPNLCKHGMRLPLGISHVYTNIEGALSAGGRLFAARSMFSVPAPPSLSSAPAGDRLIFPIFPPRGAVSGNKTRPPPFPSSELHKHK